METLNPYWDLKERILSLLGERSDKPYTNGRLGHLLGVYSKRMRETLNELIKEGKIIRIEKKGVRTIAYYKLKGEEDVPR